MSDDALLSVRDLTKHYPITEGLFQREVGRVRAVDGISFDLDPGETLGLIGESGCGKSTAARTMLRLEEPTGGTVTFAGEAVTAYDRSELRRFRRRAQMVFQDPNSSFDPRMTVGEAVAEPLLSQGLRDKERRRQRVEALLERVGLTAGDADRYPHELSGGQKQRAGLARALSVNPDLLVADEPVSALDVSVQAEILDLVEDLQEEFDLSVVFITHDMGVVAELCDRVAVMYVGEFVETGQTDAVLEAPQHPYTRALVASIPDPEPGGEGRSVTLTGDVPDPSDPPSGCRFHTRCPEVIQPAGYDLDQDAWRRALDFRLALSDDGVDLSALRELAAAAADVDPESVEDQRLRETVVEEYDLPDTLGDAEADETLDAAVEDVVAGDLASAADRLAAAFETVCERRDPAMVETGSDQAAACHLHDAETAEAPPTADD